jgi:hypothetical protein
MDKKNIDTWLGVMIMLIFSITAGAFVWLVVRNQPDITPVTVSLPVKKVAPQIADNVSNWQTYRNEKYGFSVKYPANYDVVDMQLGDATFDMAGKAVLGIKFQDKDNDGIADNSTWITVYTGYSQKDAWREPAGMDPVAGSDATVAGVAAKKYDTGNGASVYVFVNNGYRYELGGPAGNDKTAIDNYLKIASSFEFID